MYTTKATTLILRKRDLRDVAHFKVLLFPAQHGQYVFKGPIRHYPEHERFTFYDNNPIN